MLRKIRIALAIIFWVGVTLLFLDFTGVIRPWIGWLAKIQLVPAILAVNVGVVAALILLTLLLGRVYCSVICPLGVTQDFISWLGRRGSNRRRYKYSYSRAITWLRVTMLVIFAAALAAGIAVIPALLEPYSIYGRFVSSTLGPLGVTVNNLLADSAAKADSYTFYTVGYRMQSLVVLGVALAEVILIAILAWRNGRTWCNTVCPVGTLLGFISRWSWLKPVIDTSKCVNCGLCARACKGACIDAKHHAIDYSRCVACMDCLDNCTHNAISYTTRRPKSGSDDKLSGKKVDESRRAFVTGIGIAAATSAVKAASNKVDGGLAAITDKKAPARTTPIVPPGAISLRHLQQHCTACQLCVSSCPNGVLRPSTALDHFMQPVSSYENGYCRPECTECSHACPTGAIRPVTVEEKSSIQIGHAVWIKDNCIPLTDGVPCGNCARHCPSGAITMIPSVADDPESLKIPMVDTEKCIGCGACEYVCPSRPFSAIYVEGNERHREI